MNQSSAVGERRMTSSKFMVRASVPTSRTLDIIEMSVPVGALMLRNPNRLKVADVPQQRAAVIASTIPSISVLILSQLKAVSPYALILKLIIFMLVWKECLF